MTIQLATAGPASHLPAPRRSALMRSKPALQRRGARGKWLCAVTDEQARAPLSIGAMIRVADFSVANCANPGVRQVGVLTQHKPQRLVCHLRDQRGMNRRSGEPIDVVPAEQGRRGCWRVAMADAVHQNLGALSEQALVLAGDHACKLELARLLADRLDGCAERRLAPAHATYRQATPFGVVQTNGDGQVTGISEMPARETPMSGLNGRCLVSVDVNVSMTTAL